MNIVQTLSAAADVTERQPCFYESILQTIGHTPLVKLKSQHPNGGLPE